MTGARIAVDIGGTFTDVALQRGDRLVTAKVLTTRDRPETGVLEAVRRVMATAEIPPSAAGLVIHGTTLATNAIIERRGARTALITTEGHRDALEMAHENRFEQYDIGVDRPPPLVPRHLRLPVRERMDASGRVLLPLDETTVHSLLDTLDRSEVESVAVGLIHGYANPGHERRIGEILAAERPELAVTLSSVVCPEVREYERLSTACANAYVQPLMAGYLRGLAASLKERGIECPFLLMTSGGGLTTLEAAIAAPIRLVESGPAGGAILASHLARELELGDVLSFDMGGTTAKLSLIDGGEPLHSRTFEVARSYRFRKGSGIPVRVPVIEMVEIGAGGGSIAAVDELGRLTVGPRSAGAEPGPAAYGRGGRELTVTDADVLLGRIDPGGFAGGEIGLDPTLAERAAGSGIGAELGLGAREAALAVSEVVDENMANAARTHAVEWGKGVEGRTLVAFGGSAPIHAARLADKLGLDRFLVPAHAGVGSAVGFLLAPISYEVVRSRYMRLSHFDAGVVRDVVGDMRAEAASVVEAGAPGARTREETQAYMRYAGQGHEIGVRLPDAVIAGRSDAAERLREAFGQSYEAVYGRTIPGLDVEVLSWTLVLSAEAEVEVPLVAGPERSGGALVAPALVTEDHTTTVVPEGWRAKTLPGGHLLMRRTRLSSPPRAGAKAPGASTTLDEQIAWSRLLSVVEEQAQTLVRTAFSTPVREAGDLSAGVFDLRGRMLAQAVTGTPGHVNAMAASVGFFLRDHPVETLREGDVLVTNDPWEGTGHLNDFTVVTPAFLDGCPVALFASTSHIADVGGRGFGADANQVFEEGIRIPIGHLAREGRIDETLIRMVRANVRDPDVAEGDLYSLVACNHAGGERLSAMMREFGLESLDELAETIVATSRRAMLREISALRPGTYGNRMTIDGYDHDLVLACSLAVAADGVHLDFSGTSPISPYGINVPETYTRAYGSFGVRCVVGSGVPNNAGSLGTIRVTAPLGCLLNAPPPAAVSARHAIGQMLPDVVLGCLAQAMPPGSVPAEGASCLWLPVFLGGAGVTGEHPYGDSAPFVANPFHTGGTGARPGKDGLSATSFPSGVRSTPIEITETVAPLVFWRKELVADSGGAGEHRGGLGQLMEISHADGAPFAVSKMFERVRNAARGRDGGGPGALGRVHVPGAGELGPKGREIVPPGSRLILQTPGGGGLGDPRRRSREMVARDVREGLVTPEAARRDYGWEPEAEAPPGAREAAR